MSYQFLDIDDSDDQNDNGRALELKFSIGYNSSMTGAVHNLTIKRGDAKITKEIFYITLLYQHLLKFPILNKIFNINVSIFINFYIFNNFIGFFLSEILADFD